MIKIFYCIITYVYSSLLNIIINYFLFHNYYIFIVIYKYCNVYIIKYYYVSYYCRWMYESKWAFRSIKNTRWIIIVFHHHHSTYIYIYVTFPYFLETSVASLKLSCFHGNCNVFEYLISDKCNKKTRIYWLQHLMEIFMFWADLKNLILICFYITI